MANHARVAGGFVVRANMSLVGDKLVVNDDFCDGYGSERTNSGRTVRHIKIYCARCHTGFGRAEKVGIDINGDLYHLTCARPNKVELFRMAPLHTVAPRRRK